MVSALLENNRRPSHPLYCAFPTSFEASDSFQAFLTARETLLNGLDAQAAKSVIEASTLLGRKWLFHPLLLGPQAHRFRALGSSTRTDSAPWLSDALQALRRIKPTEI
jgi:hypothetical protein